MFLENHPSLKLRREVDDIRGDARGVRLYPSFPKRGGLEKTASSCGFLDIKCGFEQLPAPGRGHFRSVPFPLPQVE